ncbi:hypothetical protein Bbelb_441530 [Branchiostoma belcheri]|nr:hypothetical protein Bbelb_441530 [Branchiostoma belcheri]
MAGGGGEEQTRTRQGHVLLLMVGVARRQLAGTGRVRVGWWVRRTTCSYSSKVQTHMYTFDTMNMPGSALEPSIDTVSIERGPKTRQGLEESPSLELITRKRRENRQDFLPIPSQFSDVRTPDPTLNHVTQLWTPGVSEVTVTSRNFRQLQTTSDTCHPTPQVSEVTVTSRNFRQLRTPSDTCHPTLQINPSVKLGRLKKYKLTNVDSDSPLFVDALGDQGRQDGGGPGGSHVPDGWMLYNMTCATSASRSPRYSSWLKLADPAETSWLDAQVHVD